MMISTIIVLASSIPVAAAPEGLDMVMRALATSPGLLAAVVIVWLNGRQSERIEASRQKHDEKRDKAREEHEAMMASRYRNLVESNHKHIDAQAETLTAALRTLASVTDALRDHERSHRQ